MAQQDKTGQKSSFLKHLILVHKTINVAVL